MADNIANDVTQFCVFPHKSVKFLGESIGIQYLSSETAGAVAEDVSYRIRQIIEVALQFSKHAKRDHVTADDINRALYWSRVEPVYGDCSKNSTIYSSSSTKDCDIYYHDDREVCLREIAFSKGNTILKDVGHSKINVDIKLLDKKTTEKKLSKDESDFNNLAKIYKEYYEQVTGNILNAEKAVYKIKTVSRSFENLSRLLAITKTLVDNRNLYLEPWVLHFVRAVMFCAVEKPGFHCRYSDIWLLRQRAVQTLRHIDRKCNNSNNYLHHQLLRTFKDIFEHDERPLYAHYGAIVGLHMLGVDAVEQVIVPNFKSYAERVEQLAESEATLEGATEICFVMYALQCSVLSVLRHKLQQCAEMSMKASHTEKSSVFNENGLHKDRVKREVYSCYHDAYEMFGESFVLNLGMLEDYQNINQNKNMPAMLNTTRNTMSYTRSIISNAVGLMQTPAKTIKSSVFTMPHKKRRIEISQSDIKTLLLLNEHDSETRFEKLMTVGHAQRNNYSKNYTIGKLRHAIPKRKTLFSLSHVFV